MGDAGDASNAEWLCAHGITHILNCTTEIPNAWPAQFSERDGTFKRIAAQDEPRFDMLSHLAEAVDYIHSVWQRRQTVACSSVTPLPTLLVHCAQGVSRSPTCVAAYLLKHNRDAHPTVGAALKFLRGKRDIVNPNAGFVDQLGQFLKSCSRHL